MRGWFLLGSAAAIALAMACGDQGDAASPISRNVLGPQETAPPLDAGASDASVREEITSGTQIVKGAAMLAGVTSDGFVVFIDVDDENRPTARVISIDGGGDGGVDGGAPTKIVSSTGTGKDDLRYAIDGKVVFLWSDRGDQMSTLTMWSSATGVIRVGENVRPGRSAATSDGNTVLYVRDVTDAGAKIVAGPIDGGATTTIGTMNTVNDSCWRDMDLATAGDRLVARYCPVPGTSFVMTTFDPATKATKELGTDVTSAIYGASRLVWHEKSGALAAAEADGTSAVTLANALEYALSGDRSILVYRTPAGDLVSTLPDGGATKTQASGAIALGAVSRSGRALLYATKMNDAGATDVKGLRLDDGGTSTIALSTTSCPSCLSDSFDDLETRALVIDPIDTNGAGPVSIVNLTTGALIGKVSTNVVTAAGYGDAGADAGADSQRFVFIDSIPDPTLANRSAYGITTRSLGKSDDTKVIAKGTEHLELEIARKQAVFSFAATSKNAGVWVAPLDP